MNQLMCSSEEAVLSELPTLILDVETTGKLAAQAAGDVNALGRFHAALEACFISYPCYLQNAYAGDNARAKSIYRELVYPVLESSVYYKRCFTKPQGYPGDFLMMDMMYLNLPLPLPSEDSFSKLLDQWFLSQPSAQANRFRQEYLVGKIRERIEKGAHKIVSLACGPCRELSSLESEGVNASFTCVDFDSDALAYAKTIISSNKIHGLPIEFLKVDLLKTVRGHLDNAVQDADLVYCIGFIDYLSYGMVSRFLSSVRHVLRPGGTLILGQHAAVEQHPDRSGMEWVLDWNLNYRKPDDLMMLLNEAGYKNSYIEAEPLGLIIFGNCTT